MELTHDPNRLLWAAGTLAAFVAVCLASLWPRKKVHKTADYLVLYASQTGQAEELARRACAQLTAGGKNAAVTSLSAATVEQLQSAQYILCIASTTGEGDAPDAARRFEGQIMTTSPDLGRQSFAVLALGDRKYDAFAAFGKRLYDWLFACGAQTISPCLMADDLDATTLNAWDKLLKDLGAVDTQTQNGLYGKWRLDSREHLNPQGDAPLYRLRLAPEIGTLPNWQAGDLAEIVTPDGHRRDYSIASLPNEGYLELYVREVRTPDGIPGCGSGLLIHDLDLNACVDLRVKSHKGFQATTGDGSVLLIGAGSGLAGLRAHILQLEAQRPVWLIYGERHPVRDAALIHDLITWREDGRLSQLDLAFSQPDEGAGQYVQDVLNTRAAEIRNFLSRDGAVMVCGGLAMGRAVESALRDSIGDDWIESAIDDGRFRRDLY